MRTFSSRSTQRQNLIDWKKYFCFPSVNMIFIWQKGIQININDRKTKKKPINFLLYFCLSNSQLSGSIVEKNSHKNLSSRYSIIFYVVFLCLCAHMHIRIYLKNYSISHLFLIDVNGHNKWLFDQYRRFVVVVVVVLLYFWFNYLDW